MKIPCSLIFIICLSLLFYSCKKHVIQPQDQLSLLPPATQTGANTFGCLVNGQAFLPGGSIFAGPHLQCNYIYTAGGFYFTVSGSNKDSKGTITDITVRTDSLAVSDGQIIKLTNYNVPGKADGDYSIINSVGQVNMYATNDVVTGQLKISRLDDSKQIVSGTFYFNAINTAGDTVKITDGRFDMLYTK